jgi:hypothetical protein
MLPLATDWSTVSSLATGFGTLVLAVATFAAVRSSNRSARLAEVALQEQRRPVLANSRLEDPLQKIMFVERKWVRAEGSRGVAEYENDVVYLALSLRNVGSGIAVCQGWTVRGGFVSSREQPSHLPLEEFRTQTRDLYIAGGDIGMWQGALRDPRDPRFDPVVAAIEALEPITIELLYTDQVGEQRTITRFGLSPMTSPDEDVAWLASASRHWFLDRDGPRPDDKVQEATDAILRLQAERDEAHAAEAAAESAAAEGATETPQLDGAGAAARSPSGSTALRQ